MPHLFTVGRFADETSRRRTALTAQVLQWSLDAELADPIRCVDDLLRATRPDLPRLRRAEATFGTGTAARLTVTVHVPFDGDGRFFASRPGRPPAVEPPVGDWHRWAGHGPVLRLPENFAPDVDAGTVRAWASRAVDAVEALLAALREEAAEETARLSADLVDLARQRAEDLTRRRALEAELGTGI
ncbi:hypothetical protein [Trujillonella endophytica]|uniref:Uncharacterized protein n=1 Tax=Trujillonella endophytica TaxID=673521 RepID=A0A1H8UUW4_9ACTN|nr:hypothetical protein [Trujillella endophytica]SEP06951.1 hypothetical protein SAMN05660991_03116 [Trujillella endophytica]